ncbi:MAG: photosystem II reaction center protein PsbN [Cyanobacteria bacterium P01_A01_bin.123]
MEPATVLIISVGTVLLGVTGFALYTAFGPPAKTLTDPFEEHED